MSRQPGRSDKSSALDVPSGPGRKAGLVSARGQALRRILGRATTGAVGGSVIASVEHLGPELLGRPVLRWIVLYALLGGVAAGVWDGATEWITTRLSLSRRGAALASGLTAGLLLGGAVLLVSAVGLEMEAGAHILMRLPWEDGLMGLLVGMIGGGLWRFFLRPQPRV